MSADNYIAVYKTESGQYSGFMFFASEHIAPPCKMPDTEPLWTVNLQEQAVDKCEEEYLEYGYEFIGE